MFEDKTDCSETVKKLLINSLTKWQGQNVKNEEKAFSYFFDDSEYLLRMLWQGRLSKMSENDRSLHVWISENYVPKEYGFDSKKVMDAQLIGLEFSHESLARMVLKKVWSEYLISDENIIKPPKEKISFLKKMFR
jgi:hypothetical protein